MVPKEITDMILKNLSSSKKCELNQENKNKCMDEMYKFLTTHPLPVNHFFAREESQSVLQNKELNFSQLLYVFKLVILVSKNDPDALFKVLEEQDSWFYNVYSLTHGTDMELERSLTAIKDLHLVASNDVFDEFDKVDFIIELANLVTLFEHTFLIPYAADNHFRRGEEGEYLYWDNNKTNPETVTKLIKFYIKVYPETHMHVFCYNKSIRLFLFQYMASTLNRKKEYPDSYIMLMRLLKKTLSSNSTCSDYIADCLKLHAQFYDKEMQIKEKQLYYTILSKRTRLNKIIRALEEVFTDEEMRNITEYKKVYEMLVDVKPSTKPVFEHFFVKYFSILPDVAYKDQDQDQDQDQEVADQEVAVQEEDQGEDQDRVQDQDQDQDDIQMVQITGGNTSE